MINIKKKMERRTKEGKEVFYINRNKALLREQFFEARNESAVGKRAR